MGAAEIFEENQMTVSQQPFLQRAVLCLATAIAISIVSIGCAEKTSAVPAAPQVETAALPELKPTTPAIAVAAAESKLDEVSVPPLTDERGAAPAPAASIPREVFVQALAHPFPKRLRTPEFPKGMEWINSGPLTKRDLQGKFVLLDFWTYCCINCMHILPELKKLEHEFPNELVVIGVHSAKFETEKDRDNIISAVMRYEIQHPVINDDQHKIWEMFGISSWPTALLIDPEGYAVWGRSGEFKAEEVSAVLDAAIPYYRANKLLDEKPLHFALEANKALPTPLRFPGKVLADEASNRLFISDSNHNRIVVATLAGQLLDVIGSGKIGRGDGDFATATFDHPQGCALVGETLYVADTENHSLRKVDLKAKTVTTIAGTGAQAQSAWPGLDGAATLDSLPRRYVGPPSSTALSSPWALWIHDKDLYIAMAGPHQIWKMPLDESEIGPYAGNGREDIVDGPLLPRRPYMAGFSSFAQPSGLTSDGTWLYVADSEGSSVRKVPFDPKRQVGTVVGSDHLSVGRLFAFGDHDGPRRVAKLQHCLGVTYLDGKIYVADTYNNKIKVVDAKTGDTATLAGESQPGNDDQARTFDEPAGISHAKGLLYVADTNNHAIRTLELATGKVRTLPILGLTPPTANGSAAPAKPSFTGAAQEKLPLATLTASDGAVQLQVELKLPAGWKINPLAPMSYYLDAAPAGKVVDRAALGKQKVTPPAASFDVRLPVLGEGEDAVTLGLNYYYCQEGDQGVCKIGSVQFTVPLKVAATATATSVNLPHLVAD
jgi:thiol-disulfide isomerase/thioredoxin